jgi:hypothetical protein
MARKLLLGLVVGLLALGAFFAVAKAGTSTTDGINVDYKGELLAAADELLDSAMDLLATTRENLFEPLKKVKDLKVEAQGVLESCLKFPKIGYQTCVNNVEKLIDDPDIQTDAEDWKQTAYQGLQTVHDELGDLEAAVQDLIQNIEAALLEGLIGQTTAESLIKATIQDEEGLEHPYAPLLVIMVFLSDKNIYLVEIDKLLEIANEYESEVKAWLHVATNKCKLLPPGDDQDSCYENAMKQALKALKSSIKVVKQTEQYVWLIKDNIKDIKAWLCGFKQLVIRAPLLVPPEVPTPPICPWCLPPLGAAGATELRTYSENGTIRFAALGGAVQGMRVQVFNLSGKTVFDSGLVAGNMLAWRTHDVANGVYLYTIEVKTAAGVTRSEVRKLAVLK